ncbi:MAG: STAS/SEC14 domain-containing protein [Burkholderiales bacterium]|nr:STAS/SEC14 domain-containing protein [Burkholderiales bacterium]
MQGLRFAFAQREQDKRPYPMHARVFRSDGFVRVEVSGAADLDGLLRMMRKISVQTRSHGDTLMLVNLQKMEGELNFTGHYVLGEQVAQHLSHLTKLASVVQPGKITKTSEKVARAQGVQLSVFDSERDAMAWLLMAEQQTQPGDTAMMDPVRTAFWEAFQHLFPLHAQAIQMANGNLVISWPMANDPNALYEMSTPITIRFEPELLQVMLEASSAEQRKRIAAQQENVFRAGLVGYDPYAMVPKARVIVLG